jgi:hypothetical protein
MKPNTKSLLLFLSVWFLVILACGPSAAVSPTPTAALPTDTETADPTQPAVLEPTATATPLAEISTATLNPESQDTATPPPPTATAGPQCRVLQNLNFRNGPGLAYREPIGFVLKDAIVVPTGYNPIGVPGGAWVLINDQGKDGWIAAESNFIDCNFDLATLPSVEVDAPPPPPPPSSVQTSDAEGGCGPDNGNPDCVVTISDDFLIQFQLFENGQELTADDGVKQISFEVRVGAETGDTLYETIESTSAYCIFGGNDRCNDWPVDGNTYVWPSGIPVSDGTYFIEIVAIYKDTSIRWAADFEITQP